MIDKFLNFYNKYPWVSLIIVMQWLATAFVLTNAPVDKTNILLMTFMSTIIFAYFGFKVPND